MAFSNHARNIGLDESGILYADCKSKDGYKTSRIVLDHCIGNVDGSFQWFDRNFTLTSQDLHLDGTILSATLKTRDGRYRDSYIDLDEFIENIDGVLTLMPPSDLPPPHPEEPTSRSDMWTKKCPGVRFLLLDCNDPEAVPDSYFVKLEKDRDPKIHIQELESLSEPSSLGPRPIIKVQHQYEVIEGTPYMYAAELSGEGLLRVAQSSGVKAIISDTKGRPAVGPNQAPWGFHVISSAPPFPAGAGPMDLVYNFVFPAVNPNAQVDVYVIDSGIDLAEPTLQGRVGLRVAIDENGPNDFDDNPTQLHGTLLASIIAELAPRAVIHSNKTVMHPDGQGFYSKATDNARALDWVRRQVRRRNKPSVVIFAITQAHWVWNRRSGQFEEFTEVSDKVRQLVNRVPVCAAAGNYRPALLDLNVPDQRRIDSARNYTPGYLDDVITAAASDINNNLCDFSARGAAVTILAPGHDINVSGRSCSGTSFAAAHVTGVVANMLSEQPAILPQNIMNELINRATVLPPQPSATPALLLHN